MLFFYNYTNLCFIKHKCPIAYRHSIFITVEEGTYIFLYGFGLIINPVSHTRNIGHDNHKLQFIYYNTTYNICTATQYNVINNNTKFKGQLEVEFVTKSRYLCFYINVSKS